MKKLFFTISVFVATVFTNQIMNPMTIPITPPNCFFIEPRFQCDLGVHFATNHMFQLEYIIKSLDDKLSPLTGHNSTDIATILLTLSPRGTEVDFSCYLLVYTLTQLGEVFRNPRTTRSFYA
jgi:hypothetical protein